MLSIRVRLFQSLCETEETDENENVVRPEWRKTWSPNRPASSFGAYRPYPPLVVLNLVTILVSEQFILSISFVIFLVSSVSQRRVRRLKSKKKIRIVIGPTKINFPIRLSMSAMGWMFSMRLESLAQEFGPVGIPSRNPKSIFLYLDMLL